MSDYILDTTTRQEGAVILDGRRYLRAGLTRTVQLAVIAGQRNIRKIDEQMKAAEADGDEALQDELQEQAIEQGIGMVGALLDSENGAEPADVYLKMKWKAGELRADVHLWPLMAYLTEGMQQPVPPA